MPSSYRYIHHVNVLRLTLFKAETFSIFTDKISAESGIQINSAAINNLVNTNILKGERQTEKKERNKCEERNPACLQTFPWVDTPHGSKCPICALPFWAVILPFFFPCMYNSFCFDLAQ